MKSLYTLFMTTLAASVFSQPVANPEVKPDGRVTFRLQAPGAREVKIQCESLPPATMQKDDHGVWSYTTQPLGPDYYGYSFMVDGFRVMDPDNALIKYNLLNSESEVHVPGPLSLPWEVNDVPHGVLHRHIYKSTAAGDERAYFVYTPPGYRASARQRYPALYLLHGYSDDATGWWSVGQANVILDNLIARGQAKPMIVVMPLGYGTMEIVQHGWGRVREQDLWKRNLDQFGVTLLDEVLPQVEAAYHVSKDRKNRAIAGLSMGGAESLIVGLNHLDRFAWVGAFSSGGLDTNFAAQFPALDSRANTRLRRLWISCGKDDGLIGLNRNFVQWLQSQNVKCEWHEVPGVHSWRVWRRNLSDLAPLLFQ
ncbi:MAG: esterase [Limisphaerales bacterium]